MCSCWTKIPAQRPAFSTVVLTIAENLAETSDYLSLGPSLMSLENGGGVFDDDGYTSAAALLNTLEQNAASDEEGSAMRSRGSTCDAAMSDGNTLDGGEDNGHAFQADSRNSTSSIDDGEDTVVKNGHTFQSDSRNSTSSIEDDTSL